MIHLVLHLLMPGLIAWIFFRHQWIRAWLIMGATMIVDVDHLLATPVFDPNRCSIGFHPLHSYIAIFIYALMVLLPKLRILSIGLLIHMLLDYLDCLTM
ncbi:DUF6122 family protein [Rhodocytophaga aerolata]